MTKFTCIRNGRVAGFYLGLPPVTLLVVQLIETESFGPGSTSSTRLADQVEGLPELVDDLLG